MVRATSATYRSSPAVSACSCNERSEHPVAGKDRCFTESRARLGLGADIAASSIGRDGPASS